MVVTLPFFYFRDEFIFYSKRLIRLVIEYALSLLPYTDKIVSTPQGVQYRGKKCSVHPSHICGVNVATFLITSFVNFVTIYF